MDEIIISGKEVDSEIGSKGLPGEPGAVTSEMVKPWKREVVEFLEGEIKNVNNKINKSWDYVHLSPDLYGAWLENLEKLIALRRSFM